MTMSPTHATASPSARSTMDVVEHTTTQPPELELQAHQHYHDKHRHHQHKRTSTHKRRSIADFSPAPAASVHAGATTSSSRNNSSASSDPDSLPRPLPVPFVAPSSYLRHRSTDHAHWVGADPRQSHEHSLHSHLGGRAKPMSPLDQEQLEGLVSAADADVDADDACLQYINLV